MEGKFKKYQRTQVAEIREVTEADINDFKKLGELIIPTDLGDWKHPNRVSISDSDLKNGSPKIGDMIARNPLNHQDQWLIEKEYFERNFSEIKTLD